MRWSRYLLPTLKEIPSGAEVQSHRLMLRAGMIRLVASGVYEFLPLGLRVLRAVEGIVREEMDRAGGLEIRLPILQPAELWQASGRWEDFGPEMFKLVDRKEQAFALGPTHEEITTDLARREIRSYRDLPLLLYQINEKYRDEIRPRYGLLRSREFLMKDGYSFHATKESLEETYRAMDEAYRRICERCHVAFVAIEASTGLMGGDRSQEFMALADCGEDWIVICSSPSCGYAANASVAAVAEETYAEEAERPLEKGVATPEKRTAEEVATFFGVPVSRIVKTFLYESPAGRYAVLVRGDHELEEEKLRVALRDPALRRIDDEQEVVRIAGAPFGSLGPIGLALPVLADLSLRGLRNGIVGGNREGTHHRNVNLGRDVRVDRFLPLRRAQEGDRCPCCNASLAFRAGIEIGHIFQLGTKYSESLGARFLDAEGNLHPLVMGCYGIGVSRLVAAVIEGHHDEKGIVWPVDLAPFPVAITLLGPRDPEQLELAAGLTACLAQDGIEALVDDRDETPGEKFHDAELVGFPVQVVLGRKGLVRGEVELHVRRTAEVVPASLAAGAVGVARTVREVLGTLCRAGD
jgi:prolyl-tRNA synthetase